MSQSVLCPTSNIFLLVLHSSSNSNEVIFFRVIIISTDFSTRKPFCFMIDKTGYHIILHLIFSSFSPFLFFSTLLVFHVFLSCFCLPFPDILFFVLFSFPFFSLAFLRNIPILVSRILFFQLRFLLQIIPCINCRPLL